ncbi:transporter [Ganoderma sinense ZZ0214-1]|uniref:Transporter n=1 Tax=Ganoderma sinense ZZ0214-1 TaxID=1077348 RepID=A0A2G8SDQ6_9APHY|nr:transporter [Ganoderma sinense ZZ0214-1]
MVSPLWKAASDGNLESLSQLLREASPVDVEVKDFTGVTPLIEAVKNGHVEVVRILLDKGADPTNGSSQGPPDSYTSDPVILELLSAARSKLGHSPGMHSEVAYSQEQQPDATNVDPASAGFYPPPGAYYYPPMPVPPPMMPDGSVPYYVPPPPMPTDQNSNGLGNLPPPEVARMIPCRYYPACRYGASCMFAHPQGSYMQGPMPPPTQYPASYDSMNPGQYPPPTYYPVPPSPYSASPNGAPNHMSPPPIAHTASGSDVMSPVQAPFSPANGQPPVPYGVVSPVSPTYGHPAPVPISGPVPPLPPLQTSPTVAQPPPPPGMYPSMSPNGQVVPPPYAIPPQYATASVPNGDATDAISPKSPVHPPADGYVPGPISREMSHHRRGGPRRPSFGGRGGKPPCLFFPSGRCRNGDDCRFPHVLPDGPGNHHPSHFSARGGHRPRPPFHANGVAALEEKFAVMTTTQDVDKAPIHVRKGTGASTDSSRSQSAEPGQKGRLPFKPNGNFVNNARPDRKFGAPKPQRVPNADEFPVLGGSVPSSRASSNGTTTPRYSGPTAAQVLQAPAPRKDGQTRGSTPDLAPVSKPEVNGVLPDQAIPKLPLSFAAAATAVPDPMKEVSVSA